MDDPRTASPSPSRPVTAGMRPDDAVRSILSDCVAQITVPAAVLKAGRSVDGLHRLRVALRRLDVALQMFAQAFRQLELEALRRRGKSLSGRMGPARDLDVFVETLLDAAPRGAGGGRAALRRRAEAARDDAWKAVDACVRGEDFARFLHDVAVLAAAGLPTGRDPRLSRIAAHILDRQLKRVTKRGRAAKGDAGPGEAALHRLRIALKKLRYAAEFFAPLYPARKVKAYLKQVRALQEHLGDLNDIANVRHTLARVLPGDGKERDGGARLAADRLEDWYDTHAGDRARQALRCYAEFRTVRPFW